MAPTRRLKELISAALPKIELPDATRFVVALSGGADSAALALLVLETGREMRAVHVDHQLSASPLMADAARAIAATLDLDLDIHTVTVGQGPSPEDQARDARYEAFSTLGEPILTGHTRDDSVETMLINLIRGSGPAGLRGIPEFRPPNIHRPMLAVTRSETREVAALAGLPFVDDPMNQDMSLTRNRVRLEIMPQMRQLNPQLEVTLARTAGIIQRDDDFLEGLTPRFASWAEMPVSVVTTLPKPIADRLLRNSLEATGVGATADRMERMWSVATGHSHREELASGRVVVRRGALLVIE